jgi:diadenosine tetraphosphatase ApaH/serine/threonine PP2A family protein phosphatase
VFPDIFEGNWDPGRIRELTNSINRFCFCGHTHIPCAISSEGECTYPPGPDKCITLDPGKKYIINTGSVGQPRDRDSRACYLLWDGRALTVQWRRVAYDITATIAKIEEMCGKDNWCAQRLLYGK